jgi:hypothetical protein
LNLKMFVIGAAERLGLDAVSGSLKVGIRLKSKSEPSGRGAAGEYRSAKLLGAV